MHHLYVLCVFAFGPNWISFCRDKYEVIEHHLFGLSPKINVKTSYLKSQFAFGFICM